VRRAIPLVLTCAASLSCAPMGPYRGASPAPGAITAFATGGADERRSAGASLSGADPSRHYLGALSVPTGADSLVLLVYGDNRPGFYLESHPVEYHAVKHMSLRDPGKLARGLLFLPVLLVEAIVPTLDGPRDLLATLWTRRPTGGGERRVLTAMERIGRADAVLSMGDVVFAGERGRLWDDFARLSRELRERSLYLAAPGNHESMHDPTAEASWNAVVMTTARPGKNWYAVDAPRAGARFVFLDSNVLADPHDDIADSIQAPYADEQLAWADSMLATGPRLRFVVFHHPIVSAGHYVADWNDPAAARRRERLFELCIEHDVTAVLTGHEHLYQRVFVRGPEGHGFWHVTTGGGGSPLYAIDRRVAEAEWAKPLPAGCELDRSTMRADREYHFCRMALPLDTGSTAVRLDAYRASWRGNPERIEALSLHPSPRTR
jgi:hypothetical protein